jgi:hypothetical protein
MLHEMFIKCGLTRQVQRYGTCHGLCRLPKARAQISSPLPKVRLPLAALSNTLYKDRPKLANFHQASSPGSARIGSAPPIAFQYLPVAARGPQSRTYSATNAWGSSMLGRAYLPLINQQKYCKNNTQLPRRLQAFLFRPCSIYCYNCSRPPSSLHRSTLLGTTTRTSLYTSHE